MISESSSSCKFFLKADSLLLGLFFAAFFDDEEVLEFSLDSD